MDNSRLHVQHYYTTGTTEPDVNNLELGEIAVGANNKKACLYFKDKNNTLHTVGNDSTYLKAGDVYELGHDDRGDEIDVFSHKSVEDPVNFIETIGVSRITSNLNQDAYDPIIIGTDSEGGESSKIEIDGRSIKLESEGSEPEELIGSIDVTNESIKLSVTTYPYEDDDASTSLKVADNSVIIDTRDTDVEIDGSGFSVEVKEDGVDIKHMLVFNDLGNLKVDGTKVSLEGHTHNQYLTGYTEQYKGTVTGVTAGNGLTGGGTKSSGATGLTLNVGQGTGITVTADAVSISADYQTKIANGATAYGWGNHSGKYLPSSGGTLSGSLTAPAFYETSDERLKTFEGDIKVDFEKLSKLRKSYFTFNDDSNKQHIGVSAQEVKEIYPEIVSENENGYLSVDYSKLSVIALKAVDELYKEVSEIKEMLKEIKK